jgi:hypothetical protein
MDILKWLIPSGVVVSVVGYIIWRRQQRHTYRVELIAAWREQLPKCIVDTRHEFQNCPNYTIFKNCAYQVDEEKGIRVLERPDNDTSIPSSSDVDEKIINRIITKIEAKWHLGG